MSKQLQPAVADAIRALAEGNGATVKAIALHADLMSLESVIAAVGSEGGIDEVATAVVLLLEEAANSLEEHPYGGSEPNRAAAARAALGLEPGAQGRPLRGRKNQPGRVGTIARWLGYQPASLFKTRQDGHSAFDALIEDMAEYVVRREVAQRITEQRLVQQARRLPLESAMRIDWLARFERYYRIWSPLNGARTDLTVALARHRDGDTDELDYFARKALYHYAYFLRELHDFVREHGGLWVLPDAHAEQTVADATWMLRKPIPITELEESMLRIAFAGWPEMALFVHATHHDPALHRITEKWAGWIVSCECPVAGQSAEGCAVHECLRWADAFVTTLDAQWDHLADWYTVGRPISAVDTHLESSGAE